jgi:poly-gamma-glutamate synthesis protein (capsule biosynthesis protein)
VPDAVVTLNAVGDIALGDHPLCAGFGAHSRCRSRPPGFAFAKIRSALGGADINFGNLECTLSEAGLRPRDYHSMQMRGAPRYLEDLGAAGFTVVNVANNHALQHGEEAFLDSARMLRERGIAICGMRGDDHRHAAPVRIECNGLRVAFLGYSLRPRQYFTQEPLYAEGHREELLADVRAARTGCDSLVVSLHWGSEFIDRPSPEEAALARAIVDAGADVIIGHHPHVLRGIERRGRGVILYSLGNFVCDMIWDETLRETAIVRLRLTREGAAVDRIVPVRVNDDYQPEELAGNRAQRLLDRVETMSSALTAHGATPPESEEDYREAADAAQRDNRARSHRYFLRHLYRFPPSLIVQQFGVWFRNRLSERGVLRSSDSAPGC